MKTPSTVALLTTVCSVVCLFTGFTGPLCPAVSLHAAEPSADLAGELMDAARFAGGLVVHAGCGDGKLTVHLRRGEATLVQGLCTTRGELVDARDRVNKMGQAGVVTFSHWQGQRLPYIDNLVNFLVVGPQVQLSREEILRVLAPRGAACVLEKDSWKTIVKPRPEQMDEWTHYMYNASGNPVSHDTLVAPPTHQQWVGGPRWGRHHDHMASTNAMVSAGNRVFYIFDEGSTASIMLPSKWRLIARDAFNGVVLWKRSIPDWWSRFTPLKSGPAQLPRRLVASGDRVYVTLGINAPVSKLDAVTGETLQQYQGTENTWEIVLDNGSLYAVTGSPRTAEEKQMAHLYEDKNRAPGNPTNQRWKNWVRELIVLDAESGESRWKVSARILPGTLAVDGHFVFFHNGTRIKALDTKTGETQWVSEPVAAVDVEKGIPSGFMPSLVVDHDTIVFAGGRGYGQHMKGQTDTMFALDARDGTILWRAPHHTSGYQSPEDLLVANQTVLSPFNTWLKPKHPKNNHVVGRDLKTGDLMYDNQPDVTDPVWFIHHRCYPSKATENYLLMSKEGIEFIDLTTRHWKINHWIRGACLYGIMPANGLVYAPMHDCACSADMKLCGFNAVTAAKTRSSAPVDVTTHRLTKGRAFGEVSDPGPESPGDWPTFRHDAARSGVASCAAPAAVKPVWKTEIGGKLSAPVVANGTLYLAAVDCHTLYALDEKTGRRRWSFTAEGRIDSPPTVYQGLVLFGSRDGCVYCLRAADGALVWRFRAVAEDRRLTAWAQVESAWPVHGSILIRNGEAWFVAGRSVFLDGGLRMYRIDPETGEVLSHATFDGKTAKGRMPTGAEQKRMAGLPDVLSAADGRVFMRAGVISLEGNRIRKHLLPASKLIRYPGGGRRAEQRIAGEARPHLFSSYGFLDDSWFHRAYWVYGGVCSHRHGYAKTGRQRPAGRVLVFDEQNVYGFGREQRYFNWTTPMEYRLFARKKQGGWKQAMIWEEENPELLADALVLAGNTLFAAGAPDVLDETQSRIRYQGPETRRALRKQEEALAGRHGGVLISASRDTGELLNRIEMEAPPVFDGLIAANGRLFTVLKNGTVTCWGQP